MGNSFLVLQLKVLTSISLLKKNVSGVHNLDLEFQQIRDEKEQRLTHGAFYQFLSIVLEYKWLIHFVFKYNNIC